MGPQMATRHSEPLPSHTMQPHTSVFVCVHSYEHRLFARCRTIARFMRPFNKPMTAHELYHRVSIFDTSRSLLF